MKNQLNSIKPGEIVYVEWHGRIIKGLAIKIKNGVIYIEERT